MTIIKIAISIIRYFTNCHNYPSERVILNCPNFPSKYTLFYVFFPPYHSSFPNFFLLKTSLVWFFGNQNSLGNLAEPLILPIPFSLSRNLQTLHSSLMTPSNLCFNLSHDTLKPFTIHSSWKSLPFILHSSRKPFTLTAKHSRTLHSPSQTHSFIVTRNPHSSKTLLLPLTLTQTLNLRKLSHRTT